MTSPCVYLLQFCPPLTGGRKTSTYYLGATTDLNRRIAQHRAANSRSAIIRAAISKGCKIEIVQSWACASWAEAATLEAKYKRHGHHHRLVGRECLTASPGPSKGEKK